MAPSLMLTARSRCVGHILAQDTAQQPRIPGLLQGTLNDAFFDPLPEEELQQWE